ncbi:hypothetical protein GO730_39250 [Spirosoma sp. HMF3257]|uniref:Uncharacterized protein n=1 Tax=Spirosoma telluris TaxID=2183553 RepID=A0A327NFA5_9BACT|nr:hypothetical protein [Spirosoma telluris]RAI72929.1 hypothetical protein HMF3257_39190 [Spirosoma telluris]
MDTFIRIHTEIYHEKRDIKNPTAYIAQSLGFGKATTKKAPVVHTDGDRSKEPKQIGSILAVVVDKSKS